MKKYTVGNPPLERQEIAEKVQGGIKKVQIYREGLTELVLVNDTKSCILVVLSSTRGSIHLVLRTVFLSPKCCFFLFINEVNNSCYSKYYSYVECPVGHSLPCYVGLMHN